jgi:filamentous hemagglutinin
LDIRRGLVYGQGSKQGNRVKHVFAHLKPDPKKKLHSVFNVKNTELLGLLDEAWSRRGLPDPTNPRRYTINMGRPIGTLGETHIRIIVEVPGTPRVTTAFPFFPEP